MAANHWRARRAVAAEHWSKAAAMMDKAARFGMKLKQCGRSQQHEPVHENEACREERRQLDELRSRTREAYVAHD
eukprot:5824269-Heterocapsa_arctica.AAC.1